MMNGKRPRIVVGFGRSGTTWVQDVVAESNGLRAVFEPLHPALLRKAGLTHADFREADDDDPDLQDYLERYLSGDFHSLWADYRIVPAFLWWATEAPASRAASAIPDLANARPGS